MLNNKVYELPDDLEEFKKDLVELETSLYCIETGIEDFRFTIVNLMFENDSVCTLEFYRNVVTIEDVACLLLDMLDVEESLVLDGLGIDRRG